MAMSESSLKAMFDYVPSSRIRVGAKWPLPNGLLALSNHILGSLPPEIEKPKNGLCLLLPYIESLTGQALIKDRALVHCVPSTAPSPKSTRPCRYKAPNATQYKKYVLSLIDEYESQHRLCTAKESINYAIDRFEKEKGISLSYEQVRNWYNEKGKSNASAT